MAPDAVARLAIADLVARYCDAVARADVAQFAACWTSDAHWTGPGLDRTGADEITRTWARMRARFTLALQAIQSGAVHIDGRHGTGTWWIRELLEQSDGVVRETVGRYDDEYVYGEDGWRFAVRRFTPAGR